MITNAKIGSYVGITDAWNRTAASGAGIQTAAEYAMSMPFTSGAGDDEETGESAATELELLQPLAAIASIYGDPDGKYAAFLKSKDPEYPSRAYYLLTPGLSDSGLSQTAGAATTTATTATASPSTAPGGAQATAVAVSNGTTTAAQSHAVRRVDTGSVLMGLTLGVLCLAML